MNIQARPFKYILALFIVSVLLLIIAKPTKAILSPFSQAKLWQLIAEFQIKNIGRSSVESPKVCAMADKRLAETRSDWSHNGFYVHLKDFAYTKIAENIIKGYSTEQLALQGWLNSTSHRKNLAENFVYSCLRCEGNRCVHVFASF